MKRIIFVLFFTLLCPVFVLAADMVDINTASLQQLDTLTGIGPAYAQAIIDARPFSSVDDLLRVSGIGPKTLQKIKDQGLACVDCSTQEKQEEARPPEPAAAAAGETAVSNLGEVGPPKNFPNGVFLNEILPNPEGTDETNEWIELYNSNNFDVDLSGWQIKDITGTATTFTIPQNTKISANGFFVFKRPDTKISMNNDEDGLNLLTPDGKIIDSVSFTKAPLNQSYNKTGADWQWSLTLTPENKNIIAAVKTLSNSKNSDKNNDIDAIAAINETTNPIRNEISNGASPWFLFFTALATTIILAAIVLFIKIKSKAQSTKSKTNLNI